MKRVLAILPALFVTLAIARPVSAHAVGLSRGEYRRTADGLVAELTFARQEVMALVPKLDADRDGVTTREELLRARAELERAIVGRIAVASAGKLCAYALSEARFAERDGLLLRATFRCAGPVSELRVTLGVLEELAHGHRHLARVVSDEPALDQLCFRAQPGFRIAAPAAPAQKTGNAPSLRGFVRLGLEHILTGYDHVLFLFALLLVGGRLRALIGVVSAFTVAHSLTLATAVAGIWTPDPRIVEPAIALSIAYVGVENFFVRNTDKRWRVAFLFGLLHGFGFAGALREIGLPREAVLPALLSFNLGVELGQLVLVAIAFPLVAHLYRRDWFLRRAVPALSASVVVLGLGWFAMRVHEALLAGQELAAPEVRASAPRSTNKLIRVTNS